MARRKPVRKVFSTEVDDLDEPEPPELEGRAPSVVDMADAMEVPVMDNALSIPMFADTDGRTVRSISQLRLYKMEAGGPPAYKGTIPTTSTLETIGQMFGNGLYTIEGLNHRHTVLATKENIRISLLDAELPAAMGNGASDVERIERLARISANESHENSKAFVAYMERAAADAREKDRAWYAAQNEAAERRHAQEMQLARESFTQTMAIMSANNAFTLRAFDAMHSGDKRKQGDDDGTKLVNMLIQGMKIAGELRGDSEPTEQPPVWAEILKSGFGALGTVAQSAGTAASHVLTPPPTQPTQTREPTPRQRKLVRKARRAMDFYDQIRAKGIDPDELLERLSTLESSAVLPTSPDADPRAETPPQPEPEDDEDDDDDVLDDDEDEDEDELAADTSDHGENGRAS